MCGNLLTINGKAGPPVGGPAGKENESTMVLDVQAMADALLTIPQGRDLHMVLRKFRACTAADYELANKMLLPAVYRSAYRFLRSDGGELLSFQEKASPGLQAALGLVERLETKEDVDFQIASHMRRYLNTDLSERWSRAALETVALNDLLADTVCNMLIHQYTVRDTLHLLHYLTAGCLARELDKYPENELPRRVSRRAIHLMRYFFSESHPLDVTHICSIHNKLFILGMDHGATVDEYFGMLCQLEQGVQGEQMERILSEWENRDGTDEKLKRAILLWNDMHKKKEEQHRDYPVETPLHPAH